MVRCSENPRKSLSASCLILPGAGKCKDTVAATERAKSVELHKRPDGGNGHLGASSAAHSGLRPREKRSLAQQGVKLSLPEQKEKNPMALWNGV